MEMAITLVRNAQMTPEKRQGSKKYQGDEKKIILSPAVQILGKNPNFCGKWRYPTWICPLLQLYLDGHNFENYFFPKSH